MSTLTLWIVIISLGVGSFLLRFSFLGLVGDRPLPPWLLRHLRYTAVAILPAMVTPMVAFSNAAGTGPEPGRLLAALVAVAVGAKTKNVLAAIGSGAVVLTLYILIVG